MIWGCFSSKGTVELQIIHGRMNGSMYREILEKNFQKSATSLGHGQNFVLQHDYDPKQNLQSNGLKIMVLVLSIGFKSGD